MIKPEAFGDEKVVYKGKIIEVVLQDYKVGDKIIKFETARRSPGVRLIIIKDNKILITKEFRSELNEYDYRLPGGKVFDKLDEYNDALKNKVDILKCAYDSAKREAEEEAGIKVKEIKHFHTTFPGATVVWDLYYFTIRDFENCKQKLEHGEVIHPEWKTFEEVKQMCLDGDIKEDRSVGVLLRFLENLK